MANDMRAGPRLATWNSHSKGVSMLPNFIVIGAAKAGTTALYWYLAEHPAVFMSRVKETNFLAYGLDDQGHPLWGNPEFHRFPIKSLADYEALFADAESATAIGEASTMYLECPQSPTRIKGQLPGARIVCAIRHPVDRAYSDYLMYLRNRGLKLDPPRDLVATAAWARPDSHWMQVSKYYEALSRYYDTFPREQIHLFLFDDLKREPLATVQAIYQFIGVDSAFEPDFDTPHNVGGMPASVLLERVFTNRSIKSAVEPWIPKGVANFFRHLRTRSMRQAPSLPPELRKELARHFRDDITKVSGLIGRNLDHWL